MRISILLCVCFSHFAYSQWQPSVVELSGDGDFQDFVSSGWSAGTKWEKLEPMIITRKTPKPTISSAVLPMVTKGPSVDDEDTNEDLFIEGSSGDRLNIIPDHDCEGSGPCIEVVEEVIIPTRVEDTNRVNVVTVTDIMEPEHSVELLDETTVKTDAPTEPPTEPATTILPTRAPTKAPTTVKPFRPVVDVKNPTSGEKDDEEVPPGGDEPSEEPGTSGGKDGLNDEVDRESVVPPLIGHPGILAAVIGGGVVGLLCAILLVMFIVYRMRKKDEGSYPLDDSKPPRHNMYTRAPNKEFYA